MAGTDSQNGAVAARAETAAAEAAEAYTAQDRIDSITLTNGIVLTLKLVAPLLISDAARRIPKPPVPTVYSEEKNRDEENPTHPDYLEALVMWRGERDEAGLSVALIMGSSVSSIPDGLHGPDSDEWIDEIEASYAAIDMEPPKIDRERPSSRYLSWLRLYALPTEEDIVRISRILTSSVAVSEEDVREAVDAFRSRVEQRADIENQILEIAENRNRDRAEAAGDGEPVRGAGSGTP